MTNLDKNIKDYFIKQEQNIKKIFNPDLVTKIQYSDLTQQPDIIELYDKDNNIIIKARYQEMGTFDTSQNIWVWSWDKVPINKLLTLHSKLVKIKSKRLLDEITECDNQESCKILETYYYAAKRGNFNFNEDIMKLIKYSLYITKATWYLVIDQKLDGNIAKNKLHYLFITAVLNY